MGAEELRLGDTAEAARRGVTVVVVVVGVGGGVMNRLNDTKEQRCDSEQLATSPSVDRPGVLVCGGYMRT